MLFYSLLFLDLNAGDPLPSTTASLASTVFCSQHHEMGDMKAVMFVDIVTARVSGR